jgi:aspartyl-tRNA(Asn)/glutamyl-tRNA(Gln) amidotransferase subunit B
MVTPSSDYVLHDGDTLRAKFEGPCVPDPTVPVIELTPAWIDQLCARLPEMPAARAERFVAQHGMSAEEAAFLSADPEMAGYFEALVDQEIAPRMAMHWLTTQVLPALKSRGLDLDTSPVPPARLAALLRLLAQDRVNAGAAREVLARLFDSAQSPEASVRERGFDQVSDPEALDRLVEGVLAAQPAAVADFQAGQGKALGFLIGQVMQASGGKANPKVIRELLARKLGPA